MNNTRILINNLKIFQGINQNITNISLILFGSLLLAISSKVQVPFWPVPMTMQTFVIFLIGMTYSVRLSFVTVAFYLFEGAIGLPVFAKGGGFSYFITQPSVGFLYGMLLSVILISYFADKGFSRTYLKAFISLFAGSVVTFLIGIIYLGAIIGFDKAIAGGLLPFIPSELFKIALAVSLIPTILKIIKK